jgi:hypothetical protein
MSMRRTLGLFGIAAAAAIAVAVAIAGCSALARSGPSASADPAAASSAAQRAPLRVISAQFGVFGADALGRRVLFETVNFPAITAAPYGWTIVYQTDRPTIVWREEFELPIPLDDWGPGEALGAYWISPDRRTAVTERVVPTRLGFIANQWRYAPGDPIGAHAMRVYIDGELIREFRFTIDEGPGTQAPAVRGGRRGEAI